MPALDDDSIVGSHDIWKVTADWMLVEHVLTMLSKIISCEQLQGYVSLTSACGLIHMFLMR